MKRTGYPAVVAVLLSTLLLVGASACQQAAPTAQQASPATSQPAGAAPAGGAAAGAPVKVGVPLPLTGRHAPFGQIIRNSFELAMTKPSTRPTLPPPSSLGPSR